MSPEDGLHSSPLGFSSIGEDVPLSCGDHLESFHELGRGSKARSSLYTKNPEADINCHGGVADGKNPFLKTLIDAEAAANSAAIQLVSFKDAMEDTFADSRQSAIDKRRIARQRGLLLEKLEDFKRINKSVRQKLKQVQDAESDRIESNHQTEILLKRISQAESDNEQLKRDLSEKDQKIKELLDLQREEQENMKSALQMTKSVEATRAHLQSQLRIKEAQNNRLNVQLRAVEKTLTGQKMEIDDLKGSVASLTEKAAQDKESLKKATRAQKLRAQRFEAAIEKCYVQLKEKDAQLTEARLERDSRRQRKEQEREEKEKLVVHIELLNSQMADLAERLRKEKDELSAAHELVTQRVEKLIAENGDLNVNNATLKASVAQLEQQLADCESALSEVKVVSEERKHQVGQEQLQAAELQAELNNLKMKYANVLNETEETRDGKGTKVAKARQELQGRLDQLESFPELLSAAEQSLLECRDNLRRSERKCSEKSVRQMQDKMETETNTLRSSVEMRESIRDANLQLNEKEASLQKKVDALQQENLELVRRLASQEESLSYSNLQLDQRSSEGQALSRQLEAALADVKQQIKKVKDQATSREEALQTKILKLEAEKSRRDDELRLLCRSKLTAQKQFEVRLKDLQLSLDQSESHKQSIQNYVDFLKNSYKTMFDEGLQTAGFGSSYFLK
uniref:Outer dense fiber protein 2-like n=1 Tax=Gasterosteus aculeatus aculeatus TaxID=481459 RepID=G3PYR9_GASAC|nr:outer dense fiber protein 2-like isoform X1 [Gasterosteus aculeatus aculeatus]